MLTTVLIIAALHILVAAGVTLNSWIDANEDLIPVRLGYVFGWPWLIFRAIDSRFQTTAERLECQYRRAVLRDARAYIAMGFTPIESVALVLKDREANSKEMLTALDVPRISHDELYAAERLLK